MNACTILLAGCMIIGVHLPGFGQWRDADVVVNADTLRDKKTGHYYILSRKEKCIRGFDSHHRRLWETNPWQCLELSGILKDAWGPRQSDSIFVEEIRFGKTLYLKGQEVIMVYFSERIAGAIEKKNGRCAIIGQD